MATQPNNKKPAAKSKSRPRSHSFVQPIMPDTAGLTALIALFTSKDRFFKFLRNFAIARLATTGWRTISDVSSRDNQHADTRDPLDEVFQPLTAQIGGAVKTLGGSADLQDRRKLIACLAALATDPDALAAGIQVYPTFNEQLEYATVGMRVNGLSRLSDEAVTAGSALLKSLDE